MDMPEPHRLGRNWLEALGEMRDELDPLLLCGLELRDDVARGDLRHQVPGSTGKGRRVKRSISHRPMPFGPVSAGEEQPGTHSARHSLRVTACAAPGRVGPQRHSCSAPQPMLLSACLAQGVRARDTGGGGVAQLEHSLGASWPRRRAQAHDVGGE
eukprot:scaffold24279_cov112-Isochrysis_galbana.AAC.4